MITLTAKINLLDSQHGTINNVLSSISGNNVSADINSVKGTKTIGSKPWIIGATAIGEQNTLESSVPYYMGSVVANSNKTFETPYTITINGTDITAFEQEQTFGGTYIFQKWNTQSDGGGLNYINGNEYLMPENKTLYAVWAEADE